MNNSIQVSPEFFDQVSLKELILDLGQRAVSCQMRIWLLRALIDPDNERVACVQTDMVLKAFEAYYKLQAQQIHTENCIIKRHY